MKFGQLLDSILTFETFVAIMFLVICALNISRSIRSIIRGESITEHVIDIVIAIGMLVGFIILVCR